MINPMGVKTEKSAQLFTQRERASLVIQYATEVSLNVIFSLFFCTCPAHFPMEFIYSQRKKFLDFMCSFVWKKNGCFFFKTSTL